MSLHKKLSYIKSCIRIAGCIIGAAAGNVFILAVALGVAEILGVVEERDEE